MENKIIAILCIGMVFLCGCALLQDNENSETIILTPKSGPEPKINGAKIFGVRPGSPILYTIAATGDRPMQFAAEHLPEGVNLIETTGQLIGKIDQIGTYHIILKAKNDKGEYEREFRLVVGDEIALTPPMGCNTWGGWGPFVSEENVRAAAEALVSTGLINHGYTLVNIDDGWQGKRGGLYNGIQPNEKFRDLKQLCDDIHYMGLKLGIYSTPWTTSFAGLVGGSSHNIDGTWDKNDRYSQPWKTGGKAERKFGNYSFLENDTKQWAEWGIDYCKYDWKIDFPERCFAIRNALDQTDRDIILELSNSAPFKDAGIYTNIGNMTRTDDDLIDIWDFEQIEAGSAERKGMSIVELWKSHNKWQQYSRPGHWNMPCPLRIGMLGGWEEKPLTPTRLSPNEQYSHISLWCLWSAPIIIGCPPERLDEFTLSLLTNDEVLEINQDVLGQQAHQISIGGGEVLIKDLEDGSKALGLFNPYSKQALKMEVSWKDIGLEGEYFIRDLWRQKNIGVYSKKVSMEIPSHGVILIRMWKKTV